MDGLYHLMVYILQRAILPVILIGITIYYFFFRHVRYPRNLPRLGAEEGISWEDIKKKFESDCLSVFEMAYQNYSKKDRSVLIPVFGPNEEILLPPSALNWLCKQPDSQISSLAAQIDAIQLGYSLGNKYAYDPWGGYVTKAALNSIMEYSYEAVYDEVRAAVDACLGTDTDTWKEIELFPTCRLIVGRATQRLTLGDSPSGNPLCQDQDYITSCYGVLDGMLEVAGYLANTRRPFWPIFGPWASRPMSKKIKDLVTHLKPLYEERMGMIRKGTEAGSQTPRDILQKILSYAVKERPQEAKSLDNITRRIAVLNFGTMHQTTITLHNLILNLIGSDVEYDTISALRGEVRDVLGDGEGAWSKTVLNNMVHADSLARETMRLHSFIGRTVQRLVIAPEGVVAPDGVRLPHGAMVSILAHQAQTDPETFEDPLTFQPFRFSRPRGQSKDVQSTFVSTSASYLGFSHGRHACPGRFLVDTELKMITAYLVREYDLEFPESYKKQRPQNQWFSGFGIPPLDAKIRIRRRKA
ncbi:hypothetical protein GQX73_g8695 [Xylaria multiplex]|uniref:Cytochrome P450 n=1 Tax=Xylaria multiplex TaxID=323545 RepID=A0A7C8MKS1_9PEZI|nr:hypothetical protein GQX73_g8695 [Xylaria multiplex]